jgi:uncharacterized protein YuzE
MKPIRLSKHALGYAARRGFTVAEVQQAIRTGSWRAAELGRLDSRKDFAYAREWNGKVYATKRVRPVFVESAHETVVTTVYTYYFRAVMKISYDAEVDALRITFRDTTVTTKHLAEGIAADYDTEGRLAGLEILDAQKRFGGRDTMRQVELEGIGA